MVKKRVLAFSLHVSYDHNIHQTLELIPLDVALSVNNGGVKGIFHNT